MTIRTIAAALALCQIALLAPAVYGQGDRLVQGTVYYEGHEPAAEAAVEIEDVITLAVFSRITDRAGKYRLTGLSRDRDYTIRATKKGYWSDVRRLSKFDAKAALTVDLVLKRNTN